MNVSLKYHIVHQTADCNSISASRQYEELFGFVAPPGYEYPAGPPYLHHPPPTETSTEKKTQVNPYNHYNR